HLFQRKYLRVGIDGFTRQNNAALDVRIPVSKPIDNLQGRIVSVACAEENLELRIILKKETFQVALQTWLQTVQWLQHRYRRQRSARQNVFYRTCPKASRRFHDQNQVNGARNEPGDR